MVADYRGTKRWRLKRRQSVHFFGSIHVVRGEGPTLAERFRGKASDEQKASHKAECEQLASCYARLAEQFQSAPKQALDLLKP
jgi:hypothetical protein